MQCVFDATAGPDPLDLGSQYFGVPGDQKCGLLQDGGGKSAASTDDAATDTDKKDGETASEIVNAIGSFLSWVGTGLGKAAGAVAPIIDAELKLADPANAKKIFGTTKAIVDNKIRTACSGDAAPLNPSECSALGGMSTQDQADYLKRKGLFSCADPTACESTCTPINEKMAATNECRKEFAQAATQPPGETPDPLINWGPNGPPDSTETGLTACLLGPNAGMLNRGNLQCGLVTCGDGLSTRENAAQCCANAGFPVAIPVFSVCWEVQCAESMSGIGQAGDCLCGGVPVDDSGPAPSPQPQPETSGTIGITLPEDGYQSPGGLGPGIQSP